MAKGTPWRKGETLEKIKARRAIRRMIPIVKSPQYERDIAEIWDHIARDNAGRG